MPASDASNLFCILDLALQRKHALAHAFLEAFEAENKADGAAPLLYRTDVVTLLLLARVEPLRPRVRDLEICPAVMPVQKRQFVSVACGCRSRDGSYVVSLALGVHMHLRYHFTPRDVIGAGSAARRRALFA